MQKPVRHRRSTLAVVGCGGVGSWVAIGLSRLKHKVVLIDGDKIERKNLDRQLFTEADIGKHKAEALANRINSMLGTEYAYDNTYVSPGWTCNVDAVLCCVDNNPARIACLEWADATKRPVIIGANEVLSSEAYLYCGDIGSPTDPRVMYPSMLTDHSGDPLSPCAALAADNTQSAAANYNAAHGVLWLLNTALDPRFRTSLRQYAPTHVSYTPTHINIRRSNESA